MTVISTYFVFTFHTKLRLKTMNPRNWLNQKYTLFNVVPTDILQFNIILPNYLYFHYRKPTTIEQGFAREEITTVLNTILGHEFRENSSFMLANLNGDQKNVLTIKLSGDKSNDVFIRIVKEGIYPILTLETKNESEPPVALNSVSSTVEVGSSIHLNFSVPIGEGQSSSWSGCEMVSKINREALSSDAILFLDRSLKVKFNEKTEPALEAEVETNSSTQSVTESKKKRKGVFLTIALVVLTVIAVGVYMYFFLSSTSRKIYKRKVSKRRNSARREHRVSLPRIKSAPAK
eukprot:GAHX01003209.1.p1 GENE.GAHX01003209.1~~GAHX01003209.1.p1  ORF type:complete len:290 (-),score=30.04 GAHX01003209.1:114-983(-)